MRLQNARPLLVSIAVLPHLVGCLSLGNPKPSPYSLEPVSGTNAAREVSWKQELPEKHDSCSLIVLAPPPQLSLEHANTFEVSAKLKCGDGSGDTPRVLARLDEHPPLSFSINSDEPVRMTLEELGPPGAGVHRLAVYAHDESDRVLRDPDGVPLGTLIVFEVTASSSRGEISR
jgi:hypothetical protein